MCKTSELVCSCRKDVQALQDSAVMIFLTTTAVEIDEELLNRCLMLSVDEGVNRRRRSIVASAPGARSMAC